MTTKQLEAIRKHGEQLNAIFHTGLDPVTLCKKLRRIEGAATRITTDYCNGALQSDEVEIKLDAIRARLLAALECGNPGNRLAPELFINRDPRGYALKIKSEFTRKLRDNGKQLHTDLGDYGILAPEFNKEGR